MSWDKFIVCSDSHGDCQDDEAVEAFLAFNKVWKAKYRLHLGDFVDMRPLRRGANEEEKREVIGIDFQAGLDFLEAYKPTHLLRGNHDERLIDLATDGFGIRQEHAIELTNKLEKVLGKFKCEMKPYHKRLGLLELGELKAVHGFAAGPNAARETARTYGSVICGHGHNIQSASIPGMETKVGRMIGCLCRLDFNYNRAHMGSLSHQHGFGHGVINSKSGIYHYWQNQSIDGVWIIPSDIVII
jgi:predicted phosphodiesterase